LSWIRLANAPFRAKICVLSADKPHYRAKLMIHMQQLFFARYPTQKENKADSPLA